MLKKLLSLLSISFIVLNANNEVELNINDRASEVSIGIYANDYYVLDSGSDYYVDFSYMSFDSGTEHTITKYGVRVASPFSSDAGLSAAMGVHGVKTEAHGETFLAIPVGLYVRNEIDDQIHIAAELQYSPSVLNYFEAKEYREMRITGNYSVVDNNVFAFGGYRYIKTKYNKFSTTPSSSIYFGVKFFY